MTSEDINENVEENIEEQEELIEDSTEELEDTNEESVEEEGPSEEYLSSLTDDEFIEYVENGTLPKDKPEVKKEEPKEEVKEETKQEQKKPVSDDINYKEVYDSIFKPFKANGKEITPKSTQDVISLMQMGANYTKKMQLLAPMRKLVESLNNAGINEQDLSFLIDIYKGDKEAIKTLLKNKNIDPVDLDLEEISYYNNTSNNIATDSDVEFSDALLDVEPSLDKIKDIMYNKWDEKSKNMLLADPNMMRALHEEIQLGRFDKVQEKLESERMFGRYKGVPDVKAYIDIVTNMVNNETMNVAKQTKQTSQVNKTNAQSVSKPNLKAKAAPVRSKSSKTGSTLTPKDIFSMSEEEFLKLTENDLV